MRVLRAGALAVAVMGVSTTAWATTSVNGNVYCEGVGLDGVTVAFSQGACVYSDVTEGGGAYGFAAGSCGALGDWNVDLTYGANSISTVKNVVFGANTFNFDVPAEWCAPPPPVCPELGEITEGAFCPASPLGNQTAECAYFGLVPLDKDDNLSGPWHTASTDADLAIVKAGSCYNVYVGVSEGDTLYAPFTQGISHVTYCSCPPE